MIASGEYQYLAKAPFSCQTSIVPVTRTQFYLVMQINLNEDEELAKKQKEENPYSLPSSESSWAQTYVKKNFTIFYCIINVQC